MHADRERLSSASPAAVPSRETAVLSSLTPPPTVVAAPVSPVVRSMRFVAIAVDKRENTGAVTEGDLRHVPRVSQYSTRVTSIVTRDRDVKCPVCFIIVHIITVYIH